MTRILFVIDSLRIGGFTSSLSSLYNIIKDKYEINVLTLSKNDEAIVTFRDVLFFPTALVDGRFSNFADVNKERKISVFCSKVISKFADFLHVPYNKILARKYQKLFSNFDCVIAYCEGYVTDFVAEINHPNKIAWVHNEMSKAPYFKEREDLYNNFRKIVFVASTIADIFSKKYPSLASKITWMHNVIDEERILRLSQEEIQENFDTNIVNFISIGRISPIKRFRLIPKIAKQLRDGGLDFMWRIIGPTVSNDEWTQIQGGIIKYGLQDCVELLGNRTNPYPYMKLSDILVILSESEACPMVIIEAKILGKPIISTNFTTAYEFVKEGIDGMVRPITEVLPAITGIISDGLRTYCPTAQSNEDSVKCFSALIEA